MAFSFKPRAVAPLFLLVGLVWVEPAHATTVFLDADTPATGSLLDTMPLVTIAGTITFGPGEIATFTDPDFTAAGASGNNFNIDDENGALLSFDFDVAAISLIYGGNGGIFDIVARNGGGLVVDSFYQASTENGQPAGPITLRGPGIRSVFWHDDPGWNFLGIDNVSIQTPEPSILLFLGLTLAVLRGIARRTPR